MGSEWPLVALGDVASEITVGWVGSMAEEYMASGVPFLRSLNVAPYRITTTDLKYISPEFHKRISKSTLRPSDLVVVRTGRPGTAAVISCDWSEANCSDLVIIRSSDALDTRYAMYYLNSAVGRGAVDARLVGSVQSHFNIGDAARLKLRLPPLAEQRAIADILGALDDKIELNRRMNETLEAMARALFQSWFVDFDPVRAKAEGRQPAGMDAETAALFPDGFEESALGLIPLGWRVAKASTLLAISREGLNPGAWPHEVFDHYSIPAYDGERLPVAEAGASIKSNKFLVTDETVLISKLNPHIPRVWLPSLSRERRSICSTEFLVLSPVGPASRAYLYGLLGSTAFLEVFGSLVTGTSGSHQRVQPDSLLNVDVILPGSELIGRFTSAVLSMHERVHRNLQESRTLAATRDALLPKLLSGEVRVGEAVKSTMEALS